MGIRPLTYKMEIAAFLRLDPELHVYGLGDLDDFFWSYTSWYGWEADGELKDVLLVYCGRETPTVVGISQQPPMMQKLLAEVAKGLPGEFYAHLSPGVEEVLADSHTVQSHGLHYKMALRDKSVVRDVDCSQTVRLGKRDLAELSQLYLDSYPTNWFDARMLETGQYFGLRKDGRLVSAAGVHVYSQEYGVAALGNIVTRPEHRHQGYATQVVARLCQSVLEEVQYVGLNVKADNDAALACYSKLGFEVVAPYSEFTVTPRE